VRRRPLYALTLVWVIVGSILYLAEVLKLVNGLG
jgi:hypothetical protein